MHTPGPWSIMRDGPKGDSEPWEAHLEAAPGLTLGCPTNTEPICRVSGYLMPVEANARLIASAPALLEALEGLMRIQPGIRPDGKRAFVVSVEEQAEAFTSAFLTVREAKGE